jgi:hypothetical protein
MAWEFRDEFTKLNGSTGKEYYNPDLHLTLTVGINPSITIPEKYFVHIESSRFGVDLKPIQHWFTSEKDAYIFANIYMKKNKGKKIQEEINSEEEFEPRLFSSSKRQMGWDYNVDWR